jgi:hypothetical protein
MVNTFLPFEDFKQTAKCLDYRRLGKQRVEARQIINVIENPNPKGWKNHPAVTMWRGHVSALKEYFNVIVAEWIARGYKNNLALYDLSTEKIIMPWWMGNKHFHFSHQASLYRKDPNFYAIKFLSLSKHYKIKGYVWPKLINNIETIQYNKISGVNNALILDEDPSGSESSDDDSSESSDDSSDSSSDDSSDSSDDDSDSSSDDN